MAGNAPVGYESQKILMQYLDPNARIFLQIRCPSLNTINRMTPLRIKNYHQTPRDLTIDDTSYKVDNELSFREIEGFPNEIPESNMQLVISSAKRGDWIESITCRADLRRVRAYFLKKQLSGFSDVRIKHCFLENGYTLGLYFPFAWKTLKIEKLTAWGEYVVESVYPCLSETKIDFVELFREKNYAHDLVKNAGNLTIIGEQGMQTLFSLPIQRMTVKRVQLSPMNARRLITTWMENLYPIGRKYSVEVRDERKAEDLLDYFETLPNAKRAELDEISETELPDCVNFPMSHSTELNLYAVVKAVDKGSSMNETSLNAEVFVNFEIHAKGTAKFL